jgi:hypothetical protein
MTYVGIRDILIDAFDEIPEYKDYFTGMYIQKPEKLLVKFNPALNPFVREFAEKEQDYFEVLDEFINAYMARHYNMRSLTMSMFNKLICLSVIMPDLVDFLQKRSADIAIFKASQKFLSHASMRSVPNDFYPHLAFMLLTDEVTYNINKIQNIKMKQEMEKHFDAQKMLAVKSHMILSKYSRMSAEKFVIGPINAKPTDIILHKGRTHGLKLFERTNALVNITVADKGGGKTTALMRKMYATINMGYTVIVIGNDTRNEFRFASFPLTKSVDENMYRMLLRQGEKPMGLPIKIYCDEPKYPIEKSIKDFQGTPEEWESLSGVVLFESTEIDEKSVDIKKDIFSESRGVRTKIVKEHTLSRIIRSLILWRSSNRKKKIVLCLNEAQKLLGSESDSDTWGLFRSGENLFTEIRGLGIPALLNTQYIARLKKIAQQSDVLYASMIRNPQERAKLSETYNVRSLKSHLIIPNIKDDHIFFKVERGIPFKVRFLVPPCMPENMKYSLEDLFGGKTQVGIHQKSKKVTSKDKEGNSNNKTVTP